MQLLIGIDDTDNHESRGTGFKARELAKRIEAHKLGHVKGITRHQLFVHKDIAYTSQNSSACLGIDTDLFGEVTSFCEDYLLTESAEGSDAGLCVASQLAVNESIVTWGKRAKVEVLSLDESRELADKHGLFLAGLTGTKIGQIGALAAVGLRKSGNDGRFIWLAGTGELRDFDTGIYRAAQLKKEAGIESIQTKEREIIPAEERIFCDGWTRPILFNNISVLLVEKINFADYEWKTVAKEHIRTIS